MRKLFLAASILALAGCGFSGTDGQEKSGQGTAAAGQQNDNLADSLRSADYGAASSDIPNIPDAEERPVMQAQVMLDRVGFGPGVIDGKMGMSTTNALKGFQEANGIEVTGELDEPTRQLLAKGQQFAATRLVRIPEDWGQAQYTAIPEDPAEKAKLERLGYTSLDERLAERFHTTVDVLKSLNPNGQPAGMTAAGGATPASATATATPSPTLTATPTGRGTASPTPAASATPAVFKAGQLIRVPNIGGDRIQPGSVKDEKLQRTLVELGVGSQQQKVARIVVSKSEKTLKAYNAENKLVALFTVSSGSAKNPLPLGNWKILGVSFNPTYSYDPKVLDSVSDDDGQKHQFPPGPNSPVGVVWIDLSKEHYGIHGTPDPETIGRAQSDGCVRLTNWDAARLGQMVDSSTKVEFIA
jgi:lipoprotein-anchoring transpeptidase ErfK/SrfK